MRNLLQFPLVSLLLLIAAPVTDAYAQRSVQAEGGGGFVVSAASPNPFSVTAQFSVTVEKAQEVTVEVYNMLGQKVQHLFEGRMLAGESRTFVIEAHALPAGLYLYRVQTEKGVVSRQVTLLR